MEYFWPVLYIASLFMFFFLTLIGLPGNWLMLVATIAYAALYKGVLAATITWGAVIAIAVVILSGELIEFLAGAAGMAKGGSKKGAILAIIGSILGSFIGASLGSIVPVLGTIVGILVGAAFGAMAGAMYGEYLDGKTANLRWEIGKAAFWGKLFGSIGKLVMGAIVIGIATVAVLR